MHLESREKSLCYFRKYPQQTRVSILFVIILGLLIFQISARAQSQTVSGYGTITGQLAFEDGHPIPGGLVSFFDIQAGPPPDRGSIRRIPDKVGKVDNEGRFTIELAPGHYNIGAMQRALKDGPGPPRPNEKFFFVQDEQGALRSFQVTAGNKVDVGVISGRQPAGFEEFGDVFTAQGTITNELGKPLAGAIVLVKTSLQSAKPAFIANVTGADGRYEIRLPTGKSYFIFVREKIGTGRPESGSYFGVYGGNTPLEVKAGSGEVRRELNIVMHRIPEPGALKDEYHGQPDGREKAAQKREDLLKQFPSAPR